MIDIQSLQKIAFKSLLDLNHSLQSAWGSMEPEMLYAIGEKAKRSDSVVESNDGCIEVSKTICFVL